MRFGATTIPEESWGFPRGRRLLKIWALFLGGNYSQSGAMERFRGVLVGFRPPRGGFLRGRPQGVHTGAALAGESLSVTD